MNALPFLLILLLATPAFAGPVTNAPDPTHGQELASKLCSNCHLIGSGHKNMLTQMSRVFMRWRISKAKQLERSWRISCCLSTQCRQSLSQRVNLPTFPPTFSACARRINTLNQWFALVIVFVQSLVGLASSAEAQTGDPGAGAAYAQQVCTKCHDQQSQKAERQHLHH